MTFTSLDEALTQDGLREKLADIEHQRWSDWQKYLHSKSTNGNSKEIVLPPFLVKQWERQIATPYSELSTLEQKSDMDQVDRYWPLIQNLIRSVWESGYEQGMTKDALKGERNRIIATIREEERERLRKMIEVRLEGFRKNNEVLTLPIYEHKIDELEDLLESLT